MMRSATLHGAVLCALLGLAAGGPLQAPTVQLDDATVIGTTDGITTSFLGIPFAQPPIGNLRLQLPQPVARYTGVVNATTFGNQCIQQTLALPTLLPDMPPEIAEFLAPMTTPPDVPQSEDCLNLNVIVPTGTHPDAKLPIAVWIYGGDYQVGSNAVRPGAVVVKRSIELGQPVIFVSMNYRLSAFGFLGGSEIQAAGLGNLGLQDQREALRWLQKYIEAFGGDPSKVIIWGQSAGSRSVNFQMITNGGDNEGLFRGTWMESGSALSTSDFSVTQPAFDFIVSETGCSSALDKLECLREVSADTITAAMDKTPSYLTSLPVPWTPHQDGVFLPDNPQELILNGSIADVPFVIGTCEDDGTLTVLGYLNLTTDEDFRGFLTENFYSNASSATLEHIMRLYPADPAAGSPFGTGDAFAFTPQYKRTAAVQTDVAYHSPRRFLLDQRADKQAAWSYVNERNKTLGLGATHTSDLANIFGGGDMTDYLVYFANTLDPNGDSQAQWPQYDPNNPEVLVFAEGETPLFTIPDTFRKDHTDFLTRLALAEPL